MPKVTKAEFLIRVQAVEALLLRNVPRSEILRFASEKTTWDVVDRTIDRYIAMATVGIQESGDAKRDSERRFAVAQLRDLYKRSINVQDYKTCLSVRKEVSKILGLYPIIGTGEDGTDPRRRHLSELSDTELALLEEYGIDPKKVLDADWKEVEEPHGIPQLPEAAAPKRGIIDQILEEEEG